MIRLWLANREVDGFHTRAEIVEEGNGKQECSFINTKSASGRLKHWTSWCKKCYNGTFGKTSSWIWVLLARGCDGIQLSDSDVTDLTDAISSTTGLQEQYTEIQTTTHCPTIFKNKYYHWINSGSKEKTKYQYREMRIWNFYYPFLQTTCVKQSFWHFPSLKWSFWLTTIHAWLQMQPFQYMTMGWRTFQLWASLMQSEAAHAVEITKLVEYVDRKEDPLIQVVRTHQHNTDSAVLQAARCLKTETQKETRKIKDSIVEKTKERWHGRECMDNCHVT